MEQLLDWLQLLATLGGLGLLGGIFGRLGAIAEAVDGLKERVASLEDWRHRLAPPFNIG